MRRILLRSLAAIVIGIIVYTTYQMVQIYLMGRHLSELAQSECGMPSCYEMVISRIHEGDDRNEAIFKVSSAWAHGICHFPGSDGSNAKIDDVLFYGPRSPDYVQIVIVHSREVNHRYVVTGIAAVEYYLVDAVLKLYSSCLPEKLFDDP